MQENKNKEKSFDVEWLNSSYLETLLPGSPWQNVSDILSPLLAEIVKKQFHNEHRKQMIIELVGAQFKRSYLTDEKDNPFLLIPPNLNEDQRKKLENEAKSWLQIQINEIALQKRCALTKNQRLELRIVHFKYTYLEFFKAKKSYAVKCVTTLIILIRYYVLHWNDIYI